MLAGVDDFFLVLQTLDASASIDGAVGFHDSMQDIHRLNLAV